MTSQKFAGFLTGFVVVALGAWIFNRSFAKSSPQALSESGGAFQVVEVQYAPVAVPAWKAVCTFLDQIDPSVEVVAACASEADAEGLRANWHRPNKLRAVIIGNPITAWSKDRFLVTMGKPAALLCPRVVSTALAARDNDAQIAGRIAAQWPSEFKKRESDLVFDTGDILCDDHRAIFSDSLADKNPRVADLSARVSELTGKTSFRLAGAPDHHIGMFAAPLSPGVIAVGDVDLGRRLWKANSAFGQPDFSDKTLDPFLSVLPQFAKAGDKLVHLPLVVFEPKVYITYTNGVFETRGGKRIVYMPAYGLPALDEAATVAYEGAGWTVKPVRVDQVFRYRGTIGCLVNVLRRG